MLKDLGDFCVIDLSNILEPVWSSLRWLIPAVLIVKGIPLAFKARTQGKIGEMTVRAGLDSCTYRALHNGYLPNGARGWTEIDHLLLTEEGILVVETKTLTGQIFGRQSEPQWTRKLGQRTIKIPNPLRQNYGHVQAVRFLVGSTVPVSGQVVLTGSATFPKGMPDGVVSRADFLKALKAGFTGTQPATTRVSAWESLENAAERDRRTRQAHRRQIAARFGHDKKRLLGLGMIVAGSLVLGRWIVSHHLESQLTRSAQDDALELAL